MMAQSVYILLSSLEKMSTNSGSSSMSPEIVSEFRSYYTEPESTYVLIDVMSFNKFKFISLLNNEVLLNKFYEHFQMCEFGRFH